MKKNKQKISNRNDVEKSMQHEKSAIEPKAMFDLIMDTIPQRVFWKDINLNYLGCNLVFAKDAGLNHPSEIIGKNDFELSWKENAELYIADDKFVMETQQSKIDFEEPQNRSDGTTLWLKTSKIPLKDENGNVFGVLGTYEDITAQKLAEESLKESEENHRSLYENSSVGLYRTSLDGDILMVNPAFLKILEATSLEDIKSNRKVADYYKYPEQLKKFREILLNEGVVYGFESQLVTEDGREIYIRESAKIIIRVNGVKVIEGVVEDITDSKIIEQQLITAKNKAEAMEKIKSEFLAQMSHEIRTPLNAILSTLDFLKDELGGKMTNDMIDVFGIIDSSGNRIIRTIESILNMSELQTGSYEIIKTEFYLCKEIIEPILSQYSQIIVQKKVKLIYNKPDSDLYLLADRYSISQIFNNIFDNAVKYTSKGVIEVTVKRNISEFYIEIKDTGIGISKDYLDKIFEPFSQEYQGYSRPYDGCGLGLSVTKRYCELDNIDFKIDSERGKGTTVLLTFQSDLFEIVPSQKKLVSHLTHKH